MAAAALLTLILLIGCGADTTDYSEGGAKAKVKQLVKESIGSQYGPETAKTVKVHFTLVKEGATDGWMFVNGDTDFTLKTDMVGKNGKNLVYDYNKSFQFEFIHNGTDWTVRNKMFFDEVREERK
jgi:hypothetical protein